MAPAQPLGSTENGHIGPHPSYIQVAKPYVFEQKLQECMIATGVTEAKEDNIRLQGIAWIDSVRKTLQLPVRTYNTAAVYYHKFRLVHADNEYGYIDAAAAALFTACKIEDTLKKSKEILCAAYNSKLTPAEQVSPDDPMFESPSKSIIGLERLMLEASGFDFRNRYPQKLLLKLAKYYDVDRETVGKTAYNMSLDLYRTFAPIKQTTPTMAIACVELSGRLLEQNIEELEAGNGHKQWRTSRPEVMETLLDLLDLYTHHRASTIVGQDHAIETFIAIRITLNQEASANKYPRHTNSTSIKKPLTNGVKATNGTKDIKATPKNSPISPRDPTAPQRSRSPPSTVASTATGSKSRAGLKDGTVRFMLDPERARDEKGAVAAYLTVEEEEYEVEVEKEKERRRG
ncbi:RNA polymerase II C-terminal domain kinase beta subunit [Lignoscripta atroalba]|nr:RNA polymerase II C-terminal domain kinase beta subunit [Lignoscripta atroalba]